MEFVKLQLGCSLVILYIIFVYIRERRRFGQKRNMTVFDYLLAMGLISVVFDGLTAYTVNHLDTVDSTCNMVLHMLFLISLDCFIFLLFLYMLFITTGLPKTVAGKCLVYIPFALNVIVVVVNMPSLDYLYGEISNYSMGVSAYTCYIMAAVYILLSFFTFMKRWKYIEGHKRWSIFTYMVVLVGITAYQMLHPQALLSSLAVTLIVLGVYINQENPAVNELNHYHEEMIMGFATLVENKDGSTGGHIKRTSMYVRLIVEELRRRGHYKEILTKDYINNLYMAAPMHDIGKVAIPDHILQKPGKLTDEEFTIMKTHAEKGGEIIQDTFAHLNNVEYTRMAYQVARYHHEKWNGRGYPEGLKETQIPLCARIMAIADVFDAVSEKRCYRDAMPLEKCFSIIEEGKEKDFDPMLVDIFLDIRNKVEEVHKKTQTNQ